MNAADTLYTELNELLANGGTLRSSQATMFIDDALRNNVDVVTIREVLDHLEFRHREQTEERWPIVAGLVVAVGVVVLACWWF